MDGGGAGRPLGPEELRLFAESLAALVKARLPLPEALRVLGAQLGEPRLTLAIAALEEQVAAGVPLDEALRRGPATFPELFIRLVEQGQSANDLHGALLELAREYQLQKRFRDRLWAQLLLPVTALVLALIAVLLICFVLIPGFFEPVLEQVGQWRRAHRPPVQLPVLTQALLALSRGLRDPLTLLVAAGAAGGLAGAGLWLRRRRRFRMAVARLALRLPVAGQYLRTLATARTCRQLGALTAHGVPLEAALLLVAEGLSLPPARDALRQVGETVRGGAPFSQAVQAAPFFPPTLALLLRGAEAHGELPRTLIQIGEQYIERLEVLHPRVVFVLYVACELLLALVVLGVLVAFYLPFFGLLAR